MVTRTNVSVADLKWSVPDGDTWVEYSKTYQTESMVMETFDHYPLNTRIDDGGVWSLEKSYDKFHKSIVDTRPGSFYGYRGETFPNVPGWYFPYSVGFRPSDPELHALGTSAIAKVAPVNPAFDMGVALGEVVKEGIPAVVGAAALRERAKVARSAGGEYLNLEFGWLPLVREVQGFAKAVKDSQTILDQYRKDSGQKIRRRWYDTPFRSHKSDVDNIIGVNSVGHGRATIQGTLVKESWFSGAFKYHIPVRPGVLGDFQRWGSMADHLLGVKLTPETLWNLSPWSWAADWFANTGDILTNVSNLGRDGMVMQYGYVMYHAEEKTTITGYFDTTSYGRVPAHREFGYVRKIRLPATPYGFGVSTASLSPKQLAVIAALGLSRT